MYDLLLLSHVPRFFFFFFLTSYEQQQQKYDNSTVPVLIQGHLIYVQH